MGQTQKRAGNIREMMSVQWKQLLSNLEWVPLRAIEFSCTEDSHAQTGWDLYWSYANIWRVLGQFECQCPISHFKLCDCGDSMSVSSWGKERETAGAGDQGSDEAFAKVWTGCFDDRQIYDGIISFVCPVMSVCTLSLQQLLVLWTFPAGFQRKEMVLLKWLLTEFLLINFFLIVFITENRYYLF